MAPATRRAMLGYSLLAALVGLAGTAFAEPAAILGAPDETHIRTDMEADLLGFYRSSTPVEKAAILRLMERTLTGDDPHAVGVEFLMAFGVDEEEARARADAALQRSRTGDRA